MPSLSRLVSDVVSSRFSFRSFSLRVHSALTSLRTSVFTSSLITTSGLGALRVSDVCKPLPDCLTKLRSSLCQPTRALLPLDRLASLANVFCIRLLFWLGSTGDTAYMVGSTAPASFDSRVYLISPYNGTPGDFERFQEHLSNRLQREFLKDDNFSLGQTLEGMDAYGEVVQADPATAQRLPSDPALNAAERRAAVEEMRMHDRRLRVLASYVITHLLDANLKTMIKATHPIDGYKAFKLLKAHCFREPNNITILAMNRTWADCDFASVGIDENSIGGMIRYLYHLNNLRPVARRYNETEIVEKLLSCFKPTISATLSHTAMIELAATEANRMFQLPAAGGLPATRSIQMVLEFMEPLWRLEFQQGAIHGGRRGHSADGALLAFEEDEAALLARASRRGFTPPRTGRLAAMSPAEIAQRNLSRCFRCQGIGHIASQCANPADTVVTLADAIAVLRQAQLRPTPPPRRPNAAAPPRHPIIRRGDRALLAAADEDADEGAESAGDPVGEEAAFLARLDEVQILGEDDPYVDPFGDEAAFTASE
jgi:hypothetical protein